MAHSGDETLCFASATDLVAGYRAKALSPVEVTRAALARIDALNPILNAFNFLLWSAMVVWMIARPPVITLMFPPVTYYTSLALLFLAAPLSVFAGLVTTVALGKPYLWWAALLVPAYWMLQSVAAIKALYQLFFRASYWELTAHGLTGSQPTAASTP